MAESGGSDYLTPVCHIHRPLPRVPSTDEDEREYAEIIYDVINIPQEMLADDTVDHNAYTHLQFNREQAQVEGRTPTRHRKSVICCSVVFLLLFSMTGGVFIGLYFNKTSGKFIKHSVH